MISIPSGPSLSASSTRDGRRAAAVGLEVQERVDDPRRDRVEEVGRRPRGAVDQDGVAHGITSSRRVPSGTWRM